MVANSVVGHEVGKVAISFLFHRECDAGFRELGRQPTPQEVAKAARVPLAKLNQMHRYLMGQPLSLDRPIHENDDRQLGETLADPDSEDVDPAGALEEHGQRASQHGPVERGLLRTQHRLEAFQTLGLHGVLRSGVYKSANGVQTMLWAVMYKAHKSSEPRAQHAERLHKQRRAEMWPLIRDTLTGKKP